MSLRTQFDEIHDSITNGQRRQAYSQMQALDAGELCEMLDYFSQELENQDLALDAAKTFIRLNQRPDLTRR